MLSAFKAIVYIVLSVITVNIVHSGTTTAANFGHLDNYASVQNAQSNSECKPVCCGATVANRSKVANIKKDERDPIPPSFNLSDHQFIEQSDNLLTDKQMWKLASWVPPDRLLLSSAYSTSL